MNKHIKNARRIVDLMDNKFEVLGQKFGLDPLIGLIPVLGDIIPIAFSGYLVWLGYTSGLPGERIFKIITNSIIDILIGLIPGLGDIGDFYFKSYEANLNIIEEYLNSKQPVLEGEQVLSQPE